MWIITDNNCMYNVETVNYEMLQIMQHLCMLK